MRVHYGERGRQLQQQRQWHEESNRRVARGYDFGKATGELPDDATLFTTRKTHEKPRKHMKNAKTHENTRKIIRKRHRNDITTTSERFNDNTMGITANLGNRLGQKHCACMRGVVILLVLQQLSLGLGSYLEIEISFSTNKCAYVM